MPTQLAVSRFQKLVDDISILYVNARKAQVYFAWETGRLIVEDVQKGRTHAERGEGLIRKLSDELSKKFGPGFSVRTLREMCRFYSENMKGQPAAPLTWTNHVELMRIEDSNVRKSLQARAVKEGLVRDEVRKLVKSVNSSVSAKPAADFPPLKRPADLKLNTFSRSVLKVKLTDGMILVDCGFCVSWPVSKDEAGQIDLTDKPSYTYAATVDRVVDGDTLLVLIDTGFGIIVRDRLRLRGVNCAELGTPEGEKAKKFVTGLLPVGSRIVLKSSKSKTDQYGRFVVDVFFKEGADDPEVIIADGIYLNQELLDEGYAVRMAE